MRRKRCFPHWPRRGSLRASELQTLGTHAARGLRAKVGPGHDPEMPPPKRVSVRTHRAAIASVTCFTVSFVSSAIRSIERTSIVASDRCS